MAPGAMREWRWAQQWSRSPLPLRGRTLSCVALLLLVSAAHLLVASMGRGGADKSTAWKPPLSQLSASGKFLLKRCQKNVRHAKMVDSGASSAPRGALFKSRIRWELPQLSTPSEFHGDLGWVETAGGGVKKAKAYAPECVLVFVRDSRGRPFDRGCFARASLMARMVSLPRNAQGTPDPNGGHYAVHDRFDPHVSYIPSLMALMVSPPTHAQGSLGSKGGPKAPADFRFAPDVSYIPSLSAHNVCYVAPRPGAYRLKINLMFTNTFQVQTSLNASLEAGFAGYALAVSSRVEVAAPQGGWSLEKHRRGLPVCSLASLAESRTRGYWMGYTWFPYICRLRRLTPFSMIRALNRKNVLFLGDSETRFLYGVLQVFLSSHSRNSFLRFLIKHPYHPGSSLEALGLARRTKDPQPPREPGSKKAATTRYRLPTGPAVFFGRRWNGFGRQRLRFWRRGPGGLGTPLSVDVNLTYVTHFTPTADVFSRWMLSGKLTDGVRADNGGKFDLVIHSNQLHAVYLFPSVVEYGRALVSSFVPKVKQVCPPPACTLVSLGPWVGHEPWKPKENVHGSNNVRQLLWADETYRLLRSRGLPHVLHMCGLTAPFRGSELSIDPVHYRAPVTLAMLDLILGSLGSNFSGPLL